jgi:hypothetical protein
MIGTSFLVFLSLVIVLAAVIGWLTGGDAGSDGNPARDGYRYDPLRIQKEILEDRTLNHRERQWMQEVAALELPRRHLVC